jgi:BirA family biotin operon repressor/biotin-[acetyl-CoA-carboxylase] ligase
MFTAVPADRARPISEHLGLRGAEALARTRFRDLRWVAETGSTNRDVLALARHGAAEGTVVVADHQREGRGRQGRRWLAPPRSGLLVSVLLRPPASLAGATTMLVAIALGEGVEAVSGCVPGLKWPNDLVIGSQDAERKLAGILAETDWPPGSTIAAGWRDPAPGEKIVVVVGAGLNVNWPRPGGDGSPELPSDVVDRGTALNWVTGREIGRAKLLVAFLGRLEEGYGRMVRDGSAEPVVAAWRERSATLGRRVRVDLGADDVEGTAVDVTRDGHLVVETLEGEQRTFAVGDVVHLR